MARIMHVSGAVVLLMAVVVSALPAQVDVSFPGGSVNVNKGVVQVQHPAGRVNVNKGLVGTSVDVQHPAGSVNVHKNVVGAAAVDVQHPAGSVQVGGAAKTRTKAASAARPALGSQEDLIAMLRMILGIGPVGVPAPERYNDVKPLTSGKAVDVAYPGGAVSVRKASPAGPKQVDVAYPGGSVNVGGPGKNVDVAFPGGFVKLDPKEPGRRRNGVVVFPFGSVRFG